MSEIPTTENTFVMVKPDGVRRGIVGEIIKRLEQRGLKIIAMNMEWIEKTKASKHYREHREKEFFDELIQGIVSGPVVAMVVEGIEAIAVVRKIVGSTNPKEALPGTIRGDFGHTLPKGGKNMIHASANKQDAEREIELWFSPDDIHSYSRDEETDVFY